MTKQEINEIIAKGIGLPVSQFFCDGGDGLDETCIALTEPKKCMNGHLSPLPTGCRYWRNHDLPIPDFFSWEGFGLMMEWVQSQPNDSMTDFDVSGFATAAAKDWPQIIALALASHFTHSPVTEGE